MRIFWNFRTFISDEISFEFEMGEEVEIGLSVEVEVGIPIPIVKIDLNINTAIETTYTNSFTTGETASSATEKSISASMEIQDGHKMEVSVIGNRYQTNVPYSATLTKKFYDGSSSKQKISGEYKGINIDEVRVQYS